MLVDFSMCVWVGNVRLILVLHYDAFRTLASIPIKMVCVVGVLVGGAYVAFDGTVDPIVISVIICSTAAIANHT